MRRVIKTAGSSNPFKLFIGISQQPLDALMR